MKVKYLMVLIIALFLCNYAFAQETSVGKKSEKGKSEIRNSDLIFDYVQEGILKHNVKIFSKYLSSQTFLNLANTTSGYYSSNQAVFVLQNFINNYRASNFSFSDLNKDERNPYATGVLNYIYMGREDSANVFISLKMAGNGWRIKQITIN
jgi:Domain of unknown function (DUF4783)